jgi:putative peptide zinc metalloprotease protein
MRYDGYYILADLVEVPNLSQAATATVRETLGDWLLGIPAQPADDYSLGKRLFLGTYAVLSVVYRAFITVSILWFLNRLLQPYHLEFLVLILALLVLAGMTAVPLWRAAHYLQYAYWSRQMNSRRAVSSGLIIAVLLLAVSLAPLPHRVTAPVVLEAENARRIYVPVAGTIVEGLEIGAAVREGDQVARLRNLELELEIAKLRGLRDEQKLRLQNLKHRQTHDTEAAAQIPTAEEALAGLDERLARRLEDSQRLVVTAPTSGTILPGQPRPRTYDAKDLPTWSGLPLDTTNRGCFLETGTLLCQIGNPEGFEASVMLDQGDMEFVRAGQEVQIQLDQRPGKVLSGTIREIAEIDLKITPVELLPAGTLPTRPDDAGVYRPVGTVYQARVTLHPADTPLLIGEAGRAKVHAAPHPLARRLARYLSHTFRFEL